MILLIRLEKKIINSTYGDQHDKILQIKDDEQKENTL
jgi:hypothetical protein